MDHVRPVSATCNWLGCGTRNANGAIFNLITICFRIAGMFPGAACCGHDIHLGLDHADLHFVLYHGLRYVIKLYRYFDRSLSMFSNSPSLCVVKNNDVEE